jgi:copper oxidase (laccase) domain-containing protein
MIVLGAELENVKMAIGQGISQKNYEVSEELIQQFKTSQFPDYCWNGRYLNLLESNRFVAIESGIKPENIWAMNRCTTESDFFSYRRDAGKTGRMWAVIMMK